MNEHYELATALLVPPVLVTHDGNRQQRPVSQDNLKLASIHSNLAKVYIAETEGMIAYAAMQNPAPQWLLNTIAERLGISEPETYTGTDGDAEAGPEDGPEFTHPLHSDGGVLLTDSMDPIISYLCPECVNGKHKNCTGWAFDSHDNPTNCGCRFNGSLGD